jgi:mono/diheme cytochrome c family protein
MALCAKIHPGHLAVVLFLMSLGVGQLSGPSAVHTQPGSSKDQRGSAPPSPAPKATDNPAHGLFEKHCAKCHGKDGTGSEGRDELPRIPNFTDASWQKKRMDAQLLASILEGKGTKGEGMPSWGGKISEEQARSLVAYVRALAPTGGESGQEGKEEPGLADFKKRFQNLEKQSQELDKQFHKLADSSKETASRSASDPDKVKSASGEVRGAPAGKAKTDAPTPTPTARQLFEKRCARCHGKDGTGTEGRDELPRIPDFTDASWQKKRRDAQLLKSILDGKGAKGERMPAWRGKISEEQARSLVGYVRAFASPKGTSEGGSPTDHSGRDRRTEEEREVPTSAYVESMIGP